MSVLAGALRARPGRPVLTPGFTGRGGPSWEAKSRFMQSMGRSPLQARLAAKAGVMLGEEGPSPLEDRLARAREWDRRQQVMAEAQKERSEAEARAKAEAKAAEAQAQERSMAALQLPEDLMTAVKGGQITLGQGMTEMQRRRAEKATQGAALTRNLLAPIGRAAKAAGGFLGRVRETFEDIGTTGQELAAKKEQQGQEDFEKQFREEEEHAAKVAAFGQKRPDLSPAQLEEYVTGGVTPLAPKAEPAPPGFTPEAALALITGSGGGKRMSVTDRRELLRKLTEAQMSKKLNPTQQAVYDHLREAANQPPPPPKAWYEF